MIETPQNYADALKKWGGVNPYGQPRFVLHRGPDPKYKIGVPEPFLAQYMDVWTLSEWAAAEELDAPSSWTEEMKAAVGGYPSRGLWMPLQIFRESELDSPWLNLEVLAIWVYKALEHKYDSLAKRRTAFMDAHAKREADQVRELADCLQNAFPAFGMSDAVSYAGNPGATNSVRSKMEQIERIMPHVHDFRRRFPKGPSAIKDKSKIIVPAPQVVLA